MIDQMLHQKSCYVNCLSVPRSHPGKAHAVNLATVLVYSLIYLKTEQVWSRDTLLPFLNVIITLVSVKYHDHAANMAPARSFFSREGLNVSWSTDGEKVDLQVFEPRAEPEVWEKRIWIKHWKWRHQEVCPREADSAPLALTSVSTGH